MAEVLIPFNPFTDMIDRPNPKSFLQYIESPNFIIEELEEGEEKEELEEGEEIDEYKIQEKGILIPIHVSKKEEMERDAILERLRKNRIGITSCEIPIAFPKETGFVSDQNQDLDLKEEPDETDFSSEEDSSRESTEKSSEEEKESVEDDSSRESTEKSSSEEDDLSRESIEELVEDIPTYSLELAEKTTDLFDDKIQFTVCSEANLERLPGKGAGNESLPEDKKNEYIPNLSQYKDWRKKLCNAWIQPFFLEILNEEKIEFQSVDHFLYYREFQQSYDKYPELRDLLLSAKDKDMDKIKEIVKTKKFEKKKLVSDPDWQERKYADMFFAISAKFSQHNSDLLPILLATKTAKLMYRETPTKPRIFYELMWFRRQQLAIKPKPSRPVLEKKSREEIEIEKEKPKKKTKEVINIRENKDLEKVQLGVWEAHLPKHSEKVDKRIMKMPFYMMNRKKFVQNLNDMFSSYRTKIAKENQEESAISCKQLRNVSEEGEGSVDSLFMHQQIVRDYLNLYTPYRGVLLFHSLGSGKTQSSIAIAEGFKSEKKIFVMMPASLKTNYWVELSKAGDPLYKKNQYWEFVAVNKENNVDMAPILAKALNLTVEEIRRRKGAWMVDVRKRANFDNLSPEDKTAVEHQIQEMISSKYIDIHYNAPNLKKIVETMISQRNGGNPFDHSVVIIDEAHNFVSRIVNKLKKPTSIFSQLYHLLMEAVDCRLVLLSGTPIINYPNELAVMFNLLRGYIRTWTFKVVTTTSKEVSQKSISDILEKSGLKTYDYIEYANKKLILTRNPFGFSTVTTGTTGTVGSLYEPPSHKNPKNGPKNNSKGSRSPKTKKKREEKSGQKNGDKKERKGHLTKKNYRKQDREKEKVGGIGEEQSNYQGIVRNNDYMDDHAFIQRFSQILEAQGIVLQPLEPEEKKGKSKEKGKSNNKFEPSLQKALYDDPDKFRETFIQEGVSIHKNALIHTNVLRNRILGLTSYFRSAQETLLPRIIPDENGLPYHLVEVPMSDYQFDKYAKIRKEEYDKENAAAKRKKMKGIAAAAAAAQGQQQAQGQVSATDLFNVASSYRIFSRTACNFAFPESVDRPRPPSKFEKEEEELEGEVIDESVEAVKVDGSSPMNIQEEDDIGSLAPDATYEKNIANAMKRLKQNSKYIFSSEFLGKYSPKFLQMVERIIDPENEGLHLLYSNFRTLEGIGIFELVLQENGMEEFRIKKVAGKWMIDMDLENMDKENTKRRYTLYTGTETDEQKEIIRNIYNGSWENLSTEMREILEKMDITNKKNADGSIIQVFMITAAGAEGINLRNTRFVHIMEPYWHYVRLEQVIGRARRICSHEDLPEEQRTVKVFVYLSVMSETQKKNENYKELIIHDVSKTNANKPVTTDENLFEISQLKLEINQQFLRIIKETAMDCSLYVAKHNLQEKTPLVCYGYGKVTSNEFSSHPMLEMDIRNEPGGKEDVQRQGPGPSQGPGQGLKETWKGKVIEINGIKYALNPNTQEVYNLENYKTGVLTFEGILEGDEFIPANEMGRPRRTTKSANYLDVTVKPFISIAENSLNATSLEKKETCTIVVFEPEKIKPAFFPFVTNERNLNLVIKSSCNISPNKEPYTAKYNLEKFNAPVYENMGQPAILNTIDYIFKKMKTAVFVRIYNNTLVNFIVLYNLEYKNDFAKLLKFQNGMTAKDYFKKKDPNGRGKWQMDLSKWNATGCLLRNESGDDSPTLAYLAVFYDMIVETCHARKVNDCIFLLNRKDFPYLDANWMESYDQIYGDNVALPSPYKGQAFIPILSQSTSIRHADIPIPTGDDWENITQKLFASKGKEGFECTNGYLVPASVEILPWEKRETIFFWRGMATGCGNTSETNPRLKLAKMAQDYKESKEGKNQVLEKLDAGVVNFTRRDKKYKNSAYVEFSENPEKIQKVTAVDRFKQIQYKFNINIEGNSAAYRFGSLFKFGFCILNVVSQYKVWFEPFLEDRVHCVFVKSDLSDLVEQMEWCVANDDKCKEIAENAKAFYAKYFTKDFVYDYLADIFNKTSAMIGSYSEEKKEKEEEGEEGEIVEEKEDTFEFVAYKSIIKPEMEKYKKRYTIQYDMIQSKESILLETQMNTILIVPFRENTFQNRGEQLEKFIRHYSKKYAILIVTQSDDDRKFNRGTLLNIGFDFLNRKENIGLQKKFEAFIMHDVDLLFPPEFTDKYYGLTSLQKSEIIHYGKLVQDYYDYKDFLGGAIEFSRESFQKINGFPNHIYGWGGEDDALKVRIASEKIKVYRPEEKKMEAEIPLGKGQKETKDIPELVARHKNEDLLLDEMIWKMNGLNSLHYTVMEETMKTVGVYEIVVSLQ